MIERIYSKTNMEDRLKYYIDTKIKVLTIVLLCSLAHKSKSFSRSTNHLNVNFRNIYMLYSPVHQGTLGIAELSKGGVDINSVGVSIPF